MTAGIPWRPIAELPEALKDGREVLVWDGAHGALVAEWMDKNACEPSGWFDVIGFNKLEPTHFAEITQPMHYLHKLQTTPPT